MKRASATWRSASRGGSSRRRANWAKARKRKARFNADESRGITGPISGVGVETAGPRVGLSRFNPHTEILEEPISESALSIHRALGRRSLAIGRCAGRNARALSEACGRRGLDPVGESSAQTALRGRQRRLHQSTLGNRSKQPYRSNGYLRGGRQRSRWPCGGRIDEAVFLLLVASGMD